MIIYSGPSMLDGAPIVAIATLASNNIKTGAMVQTWILRADVEPHIAIRNGADVSICGSCPHMRQPNGARSCYVQVHNAPLSVFRAYSRGKYDHARDASEIEAFGTGERVRLGSYGDPAAVPVEVWEALTRYAAGHTGYTHQWRAMPRALAKRFARLCMASADSLADYRDAHAAGFRTFRVADSLAVGEILCPASAEAGHRTTCAQCGLCSGTTSQARVSVSIPAHGAGARYARERDARAAA